MRASREKELANDFFELLAKGSTSMALAARPQPTYVYTDSDYLRVERKNLFRGRPLMFCLSGEVAKPGDFVTADLDGMPVVVVRGKDDRLRAMVNMCTHRGSRIYPDERGSVKGRGITCPFHAWTFSTEGDLLGQPQSHNGFAECNVNERAMRRLEIFERQGVVFVTPVEAGKDTAAVNDPTDIFGDAGEDIGDLKLQDCRFFASSTRTLRLNWKFVIDTFLESYHVFSLHRDSLATRQLTSPGVFQDLGPVGLVIGVRKTIFEEKDKELDARLFSPHATLQYIVYPNVIISHQIDHIETWRVFPGASPDEAIVTTSVYSYGDNIDERTQRYLRRSIEVLLDVTDKEDFPQVARTQSALMAGGAKEFLFGRNEPGLIAYHNWLDRALGCTHMDVPKFATDEVSR